MKPAKESKSLWYIFLSAMGVMVTYLVADDDLKGIIGSAGLIVLFLVDKGIQAYLRTITTTAIEPMVIKEKKTEPPPKSNLKILDDVQDEFGA